MKTFDLHKICSTWAKSPGTYAVPAAASLRFTAASSSGRSRSASCFATYVLSALPRTNHQLDCGGRNGWAK